MSEWVTLLPLIVAGTILRANIAFTDFGGDLVVVRYLRLGVMRSLLRSGARRTSLPT
jgi:hypothetical protein